MSVTPIPAFKDNYIWVLHEHESTFFDCIDPGDAEPILNFAKQHHLQLRTILLTHHHADHIGGVVKLLSAFPGCCVYGPVDSRILEVTHPIKGGEQINIGPYRFKILFNPGHTSTHISYFEPSRGWLFCGDTLFSAGCGRVFDGTIEALKQSLDIFKALPGSTLVYCAHEYTRQNLAFAETVEPNNSAIKTYLSQLPDCTLPSTIAIERQINPFFRIDEPDVIRYALNQGAMSNDPLIVFKTLRESKNQFTI